MQISRHWRLNAQRYRLEGVRLEDGSVSLQNRVVPQEDQPETTETQNTLKIEQQMTDLQRMAS
jgi:hypothetical protein